VGDELVVRVLPDVPAIDKTFDYLVPPKWRDQVRVGTMVRVALHGRRVGGWVVAVDVMPPPGITLRPIAKVTGWGPPADVVDLATWAAWRWAGRPAQLLRTASPPAAVGALPSPSTGSARSTGSAGAADAAPRLPVGAARLVVRLPPAADPFPWALDATARGNALIVVPSVAQARRLAGRLRSAGVATALAPQEWARAAGGATVVGARAAAWAPVRDLAAVVVIDEHDESLQEERAPTWHARDVAAERARRAEVPCVLLSPCPTAEARQWADRLVTPTTTEERDGWAITDVVDRRRDDAARGGLLSERLTRLVRDRDRGRVLCVLNRTGRARLLACAACGEIARCERCGAAVTQPADALVCPQCGATRPVVCSACGATRMRNLRAGVARVREELEALAGEPVDELTAASGPDAGRGARIVVGTEAVLHLPGDDVGVVAFLELDQELLAPRYRATEEALGLLARAARVLGGRRRGGRLVLQTRVPDHPVVQAALHAEPPRVAAVDDRQREAIGYPPFRAIAVVSGPAAPAFVDAFGAPLGVEVLSTGDRWLLRAEDHTTLCDALAATPRPAGRVRVEVDPLRL
jgi:primosomal protein N' (replication factor Y)